jgi:hypothetical protein
MPNWPGLFKYDNINRIIALSVITLSGAHCSYISCNFPIGRNRSRLQKVLKMQKRTSFEKIIKNSIQV